MSAVRSLVAGLGLVALAGCDGAAAIDAGPDTLPDGGYVLVPFSAPSAGAVKGSVLITATGETTAVGGLDFPPVGSGDPYFVDGWQLKLDHVIVTVREVTLSENPDLNPNDQSQTGAAVARASGPWAIDLAQGGPLASKEENGQAVALARVLGQNLKRGTPAFDALAKYGLSFDLIVPAGHVQNVNLDAAGEAALAVMAERGWAVWLEGTATWRGADGSPACRQSDTSYDFSRVPAEVHFAFGFATPVTFRNCLNPELFPDGSRGVQTQAGAQTVAQLTFHLDHPFWEALREDAPLRWDAIAARRSADAGVAPAASVTQDDLVGLDLQFVKDAQGNPVPWRTCGPTLPFERQRGSVYYDSVNIPVSPLGGSAGLKDLADYMSYNLSTFGHLNNDGLCFPQRHFPAPN